MFIILISSVCVFLSTPSGWRATRAVSGVRGSCAAYFYPRPPGGGRPTQIATFHLDRLISIHALRVEGDRACRSWFLCPPEISIHALRVEGDLAFAASRSCPERFLSTPSGWRATAKTDKVFVCFCAKGRRICLFKTRKEKICRWRFKKDKFWVLIWCEGSGKSVCASASHCG